MSGPAVLPSARDRWLAARREIVDGHATVTASDIAAILGEDPRRGALAVYLEKRGEVEVEETLPMRRGRRLEAVIAEEYGEQTGRLVIPLRDFELYRHPDIPWLAATPDRKVLATENAPDPYGEVDGPVWLIDDPRARGRAPLQIKYALGSASKWREDPPLAYAIQVSIEIACCDARWGALCGLTGPGPLKTFDLPANRAFIDAALPLLERFSLAVVRGEPPEADGLPGTTEVLKRAYPDEDATTVPLDGAALRLAEKLDRAKAGRAAAEKKVRELENRLRARVGGASFGALPDGSFLTLRKTEREAYEVKETSYRALRRWFPKVRR